MHPRPQLLMGKECHQNGKSSPYNPNHIKESNTEQSRKYTGTKHANLCEWTFLNIVQKELTEGKNSYI